MKVKILDRKRDDYIPHTWAEYDLLYEGGYKILHARRSFLAKRPAETAEWYRMRLAEFHYKNLAGPAIDELCGSTLQAPIVMDLKRKSDEGERETPNAFYQDEFWRDPTGEKGGGNINKFISTALTGAMVRREAWAQVCFDCQTPGHVFQNLAEQEAAGARRAMVRLVDPSNVINYGEDDHGLSSVMLRHRISPPSLLTDSDDAAQDKILWTYIDRKQIRQWTFLVDAGHEPKADDTATEETTVTHSLANANEGRGDLPFRRLLLPPSLWAMDRVGSLVKNETSKRNAMNWYELLCCYPQPYHKGEDILKDAGDGESNKARGSSQVLELDADGEFGYAEPSGSSLEHLSSRLDQLERDVYKGLHNMAAAQGPGAATQIASAASKVRDTVAKQILCEALAKESRDFSVALHDMVSASRGEDYDWEASGADRHDLTDALSIAESAVMVMSLSELRASETFWKQHLIKTALALLPDADTATRDTITAEINEMEVMAPGEGEDPNAVPDADDDDDDDPPKKGADDKKKTKPGDKPKAKGDE